MILKWHNLKREKPPTPQEEQHCRKLMSSPNKVTRLWEGVGVGVLVEVARDEWKQERRVALMWLRWPEHLNPLLSLSDSPVSWTALPHKMVWPMSVPHLWKGSTGSIIPPGATILGHIPPRLSLSWGLPTVNTREALGSCSILMKHLERTYRDLAGGTAKHSPKIWIGTVPGCSVSDLEGEDFSHVLCTGFALLLWSQLSPPHTESFESPSLGFRFSCCPAMLDGRHLLCHMGFAELPKWEKRRNKEKQGHRGSDPCSACSSITFSREDLGKSLVGKGFKGSLLLC